MKKYIPILLCSLLASTAVQAQVYDHKGVGTLAYFRAFPLADRGYGLMKQKRFNDAVPLFERAVELMPQNVEYRTQLANLLVRTENYTRAKEVLDIGLAQAPNHIGFIVLERLVEHQLNPTATPAQDTAFFTALQQTPNMSQAEQQLLRDLSAPASAPTKTKAVPTPPSLVAKVADIVATATPLDPCHHVGAAEKLSATENLAAGYCALEANKPQLAEQHFVAARSGQASVALQAEKQLGYLYSARGNDIAAEKAWQAVLTHGDDANITLLLVRSQRLQNKLEQASKTFAGIDANALNKSQKITYHDEGSFLADARGDYVAALTHGEQAISLTPEASRHYYQALRLQKIGQPIEAITQLEKAHAAEPKNRLYALTLAYAYRAENRNVDAVPLFRIALNTNQASDNTEDFAYALKAEGLREEAATQFALTLPEQENPQKAYNLKREVQQLQDNWQSVASLTYRDGIARAAGAPGVQTFDDSMQYGIETVYSPDSWQKHGRKVQLYAQAFASSDTGEINVNDRSTQGAIGVRATPLPDVDWFVYAAKLVAIGADALNDWQLRTTYGYTEGFDFNPNQNNWRYLFLAPDVSFLTNRNEIFATVEGRAGQSFRRNNWVITPHAVAAAAHQKNPDTGNDAVEVGAGVSVKYWFAQTETRAPRGSADLILQWREPVGGTDDKGGPFLRFMVQY